MATAEPQSPPPPYRRDYSISNACQDTPPSPTLTNPEMILPYNPLLRSSPGRLDHSPPRHLSSMPARPDSAVSLGSSQMDHEPAAEVGVATTVRMSLRSLPPINPMYSSYEHGAPLSDIGEEETPRSRKSTGRTFSMADSEIPSPTPTRAHADETKRLSIQSASSAGSDIGNWEDFDSSRMMNSRLAADVAKVVEDEEIDEPPSKRNSMTAKDSEDEMALLNERAERILDHARKRLTHMEENLGKARHSILLNSRSSPNMSDLHQPAGGLYRSISLAAVGRKSRPLYPVLRTNSTSHTRGGSDTVTNPGLKRLSMIPEARSASALEYGLRQESPQDSSPLSRVAGYSPSSSRSFNSPLRALREEANTPSTIKTSPESGLPKGLGINTLAATSKEDISLVTGNGSPATAVPRTSSAMSNRSTKELRDQMSDLKARISDLKEKAQADTMRRRSQQSMRTPSPFTSAQTPEQWYAGAPEYKEPGSPLNANAGMGWSPNRNPIKQIAASVAPVTPQAQKLLDTLQPSTDDSRLLSVARTDKNTPSLHKSTRLDPALLDGSPSVLGESHYEDAAQEFDDEPVAASEEEQIYLNEVLEESLQDVEPEVPEIPVHLAADSAAGRHEDRLDAFDYENMFLHSALGNYAGAGTRSETPSESDNESVSTRRAAQDTPTADDDDDDDVDAGENTSDQCDEDEAETPVQESFPGGRVAPPVAPVLLAPVKPWMKNARSNSMDSVSTVATFATANEGDGEEEDDEEDEEDGMPNEILHWGNGMSFPQPPLSPRRDRNVNVNANANVWPTPPLSGGRTQPHHSKSPRAIQTGVPFVSNGMPTPPVQSPQALAPPDEYSIRQAGPPGMTTAATAVQGPPVDHPANTEILMESLIKLADPDFEVAAGQAFSEVDKDLVLDLLRGLGTVCSSILRSETKHDARTVQLLRRRLDDATQLLEGKGTTA